MALLLALAGVAAAFAVGFAVGRARRRAPLPTAVGTPVTAPDPTPPVVSPTVAGVLEVHPTGVVIGGLEGDVEYRNAAAEAMAGTHAGVLIDEAVERHLELGPADDRAHEVVDLYGPPRTAFEVSSRALPDGRRVVFVADISEPRRIERIRTDFVANISHELKTPIGALAVLAETLVDTAADGSDPDLVRRIVERMLGEAERASRTIDDLMELSRIELGDQRVVDDVRLVDVVRTATERVAALAERRRVSLVVPNSELPVVSADRTQLVSAVGNLVENAVKYSDDGGEVRVSVTGGEEWVEIAVADRGVGIPQRDLDRIFERFYRVDRARSRTTGGTGLGLSIVRHVATNHGGEVLVTSSEGEGSTFVLRLPARPGADADDTVHPQVVRR